MKIHTVFSHNHTDEKPGKVYLNLKGTLSSNQIHFWFVCLFASGYCDTAEMICELLLST